MMLLSLCAPINALPSTPHVIHAFVRLLNGPMFLNWVQWHLFSEVSQISWSFLCAHLIFWSCFCCNNSLWWFSPLTVPLGDHKSGLYFWDISGILHIVDIQICVVREWTKEGGALLGLAEELALSQLCHHNSHGAISIFLSLVAAWYLLP